MPITGMPKDASSKANCFLPALESIIGPTMMSGFLEAANADMIVVISEDFATLLFTIKSSLFGNGIFGGEIDSRTSDGKLRCVGPGLPDFATRIAFAKSKPRSSIF